MDLAELVEGIRKGTPSLAELAGAPPEALAALARVGAASYQGGKFEAAAEVFRALAALSPADLGYALCLAHSTAALGLTDESLAALQHFFDVAAPAEKAQRIEALFLRIKLLSATEPEQVAKDLEEIKALSGS